MNQDITKIIADIQSLPQEGKAEIFKILFQGPMSDKDLQLLKWTIDGLQEARDVGTQLDKVIDILDNAKKKS